MSVRDQYCDLMYKVSAISAAIASVLALIDGSYVAMLASLTIATSAFILLQSSRRLKQIRQRYPRNSNGQ